MSGSPFHSPRGRGITAEAFREWSAYWTDDGQLVPPFYELRQADDGSVLVVVPTTPGVLRAFVRTRSGRGGLRFQQLSAGLLDESLWIGHWSVLAVSRKQPDPASWPE